MTGRGKGVNAAEAVGMVLPEQASSRWGGTNEPRFIGEKLAGAGNVLESGRILNGVVIRINARSNLLRWVADLRSMSGLSPRCHLRRE